MDTIAHYTIPVKYQVDVCVAGAGPGGIAAAVSAARGGAKVLIFDSHTMPGGMSTAALIPVLMPYSDGVNFLPGGFGREVIDRIQAESTLRNFVNHGALLNAEHLKYIYEDVLTKAGVEILYYSRLVDVIRDGSCVKSAVIAAPSGLFAVDAEIFIDATGDGTLAARAGAAFEMASPDEIMPSTLCSVWAGFDWEAYRAGKAFSHNEDEMLDKLAAAFHRGELSVEDYHHTGFARISKHAAAANVSHVFGIDPTDEASLTKGLIESRKLLREYEQFYRNHIDGFADAEIVTSGSLLGVRESRRITGDYVLNRDDYLARRDFADEIGRYNFPADIHPPRPGRAELEEHKRIFHNEGYRSGESYGIPYRILLPQTLNNVLTCGRCVSTDRYVHASLRVIPGCWITGQAAGLAAAMAVKNHIAPRAVDVKVLQHQLRKLGVYFHG